MAKHQHITTSKSFQLFWEDRISDTTEDTFYYIGKDNIVFQNIIPHLLADILLHNIDHINLSIFYKLSKITKDMSNLIALFFWKAQTGTEIITMNKDRTHIFNFENVYKERKRGFTLIGDTDFTHLVTITFRHPTTIRNPFIIMELNQLFREKVNKGKQRLRASVYNFYYDALKHIRDKDLRREMTKKLKNENFKYISVYELHANNFVHLHMLVKFPPEWRRKDFRRLVEMLARQFETEFIGVDIKRIKKNQKKKAFAYVRKYLAKNYYSDDALSYTKDEDGKVYFLIRKDAFYLSDFTKISSYSRNCQIRIRVKTTRYKDARELTDSEEDLLIKNRPFELVNVEKFKLKIPFKPYHLVKHDVDKFKRLKAKKLSKLLIKIAERRTKAVETLQRYTDKEFDILGTVILKNDDSQLKIVIDALKFIKKDDPKIKERFQDLIIEATKKLRKDLFIIDTLPKKTIKQLRPIKEEEEIETVDFQ